MRPATFVLSLLPLTVSLSACDEPHPDTPEVSSAPTVALRIPYELYGVPGPWWRDNASQEDFDGDMWSCRTVSKQARHTAASEVRKEVAYRAFLDCMTEHAWTRGYPRRTESAG